MIKDVRNRMRDCGIPDIPAPTGDPPVNLTEVDTTSLGLRQLEDLFIKYTSYAQFISTIVVERTSALKNEETRLLRIRALISKNLMAEGVPKSEITAARDAHPDVEAVLASVLYTRTERDMVEATYKAFSGQARALSRVIEIRKLEYEQTTRTGTISNNLRSANRLNSRMNRRSRNSEEK